MSCFVLTDIMVVIVEMISLGMKELSVLIKAASNKGGYGYAIDIVFLAALVWMMRDGTL